MKLILTADVDHLGSIGDTVEVKDGYGRNFRSRAAWRSSPRAEPRSRLTRSAGPAKPKAYAT